MRTIHFLIITNMSGKERPGLKSLACDAFRRFQSEIPLAHENRNADPGMARKPEDPFEVVLTGKGRFGDEICSGYGFDLTSVRYLGQR